MIRAPAAQVTNGSEAAERTDPMNDALGFHIDQLGILPDQLRLRRKDAEKNMSRDARPSIVSAVSQSDVVLAHISRTGLRKTPQNLTRLFH